MRVFPAVQASLLEYNATAVDAAINAVREALARGLSWKELKALIKGERGAGNPVASLVHSLQLESNRVTLLLSNLLDDDGEGDDEALTRPATKVSEVRESCTPVQRGSRHHMHKTMAYDERGIVHARLKFVGFSKGYYCCVRQLLVIGRKLLSH